MWEFVVPEDEAIGAEGVKNDKLAEFRPQRMGLGCSKEMIQEKISENARKSRLTKLLKRQEFESGAHALATSAGLKRNRFDEDSDNELSKASLVTKKVTIEKSTLSQTAASSELSKSQKKRLKQKIKSEQRKLTIS